MYVCMYVRRTKYSLIKGERIAHPLVLDKMGRLYTNCLILGFKVAFSKEAFLA
jgi:hypothetical protein